MKRLSVIAFFFLLASTPIFSQVAVPFSYVKSQRELAEKGISEKQLQDKLAVEIEKSGYGVYLKRVLG